MWGWCIRSSPLVAAVLLIMHARTLFGLAGGKDTDSSWLDWTHLNDGSVISRFFAVLFLILGVFAACGVLNFLIEEFKLSREYTARTPKHRRGRASQRLKHPPINAAAFLPKDPDELAPRRADPL